MADIKLVLYKDNRAPRSIALSTGMVYRTMFLAMLTGLALVASVGLAVRFYLVAKAKSSQATSSAPSTEENGMGPSNSIEEQNRSLRDEVDQLKSRLQNAVAAQSAPKEIDKKNPALALFTPIVTDTTRGQDHVTITNFKTTKTKTSSTLTFELHNAHEGESTEKGYLVVLGRSETGLYAYPTVFNRNGPYLLDFEKGETFQVARFRLVNAQFDAPADTFQILIFTRKGELLINTMYEAK